MRILTSDEVRQAEQEATRKPEVSTLVLMRRAGYAAAQFCLAHFKFKSVCVVCGKGNNGGDGLVAAEALREVVPDLAVIILAKDVSELSPDAAAMCSHLDLQPLWISGEADFEGDAVQKALSADLIIDAIVGTGFKPPLRDLAKKAVEAINEAFGTVVSVDLPSGVDADSKAPMHERAQDVIFAHGIITFIAPKPAHVFGELTSGPIAVSELGVQPVMVPNKTRLEVITGQEVGITFPARSRDAHKGTFGHVLVIAGSMGKAGAAGLAGIAALRAGAGLVTVACPKSIQATVAGFAPELMTEGLPETYQGTVSIEASDKVAALMTGKTAVVLGPGLSTNQETAQFIRRLVTRCPLPLVLDADGLNAFDGHYSELKARGETAPFRVLTPHPGEAARLLSVATKDIQADRMEMARRISVDTGSCVVLKGWRSVVAGPSGETWVNLTGNPALAKGGSGDVLSGIIGTALARNTTWHQQKPGTTQPGKTSAFLNNLNVAAAVYLHGLTADIVRDMLHENTVLASDILENLTEAFRDCDQQTERELFYVQK